MSALKDYEKWRKTAKKHEITNSLNDVCLNYYGNVRDLVDELQAELDDHEDEYNTITYEYKIGDEDPYLEVEGKRIQNDEEFEKFCEKMKQVYLDNEKRDRKEYERLRKRFEPQEKREWEEHEKLRQKLEEQEKHEREEFARLKSKFGD